MNPGQDKGMRSFMEEIGDDMRYSPDSEHIRRRKESLDSKSKRKTLILWILAILVFIAIIAIFFGDGNTPSSEELNTVKERLNQLENKLVTSIEEKEKRIAQLETRLERLQQSVEKLNRPVTSRTDKRRYHQVRRGDSLSRIAQRYGITVNELRRLNNLRRNQFIYPGQKLLVAP